MKVLIIFLILIQSLSVFAQLKAKATNPSWGGYWWSMINAENTLGWSERKIWSAQDIEKFSNCLIKWVRSCETYSKFKGRDLSPLMKFDLMVRNLNKVHYEDQLPKSALSFAAKYELSIHYISDSNHPHWDAQDYAGKCNGWALSTLDYSEPLKPLIIGEVEFTPADIKAILAVLYNGAQFFVPDRLAIGEAYRGESGTRGQRNYDDVHPHQFIKALQDTIGKKKRGLIADFDPGDQVWNYPIFSYEIKIKKENSKELIGEVTFGYAEDDVEIDDIFSNSRNRIDHKTKSLEFKLDLPAGWDGNFSKVKTSKWLGDSYGDHPDSLILGLESNWRKEILEYKSSEMKTEVNFEIFKNVKIKSKRIPAIDYLLDIYYQ